MTTRSGPDSGADEPPDDEFVTVAKTAEVAEGAIVPATVGERDIVLYRVGGVICAADRKCPHQGADMTQGKLEGRYLACWFHRWRFDGETGVHEHSKYICIPTYRVRVRGDDVQVHPQPIRNQQELP